MSAGEDTVNPQPSFNISTENLANDKSSGLTLFKAETRVWKGIGIFSFIVSVVALIIAAVGYTNANQRTSTAPPITPTNPMTSSCNDIVGRSGLYYIRPDPNVNPIPAYCDMDSDGGGWTLVASVHENNINGKCTTGDKWSSEQGLQLYVNQRFNGSRNWENINVFGSLSKVTNDDYKNIAYYAAQSRDVMLWHVPNNTPFSQISDMAFLKYYTVNGFLTRYGGSLQSLYSRYAPIKNAGSSRFNELIAPPVRYAKGSNATVMKGIPNDQKSHVTPGFLQFRAFDNRGYPNALCPGVRMTSGDSASVCIGGGGGGGRGFISFNTNNCGDFAGWWGNLRTPDNVDLPSDSGRSLNDINSSILIFVR